MKEIQLDFATIRIVEKNIVVSEIKKGVDVTGQKWMTILDEIDRNGIGSFGFISNRRHSYSVDVTSLLKIMEQRAEICCYGVVVYRNSTKFILQYEEMIFRKHSKKHSTIPVELFCNLNDAVKWTQDQLVACNRCSALNQLGLSL